MKRFLLALILLSTQLTAIEVLTEAKVGYFLPTDSRFRSIYGKDGIVFGLESSFAIPHNFYPWLSVGLYDNSGHLKSLDSKSHIYFLPIGVGLKYIYPFKYLSVYAGGGALPSYVHVRNYSPLAVGRQTKWGCGGTAKIGFIADRLWNFFIDLFAEYSYIKIPFHGSDHKIMELNPANISNFTIGGAVGYHFGGCYRCDDDED